ncbi:MAG: response regulator transcription factor [Chloroflexi bacterium]|nr:response regulator transcription factor [Chloroflexota bacterium]
MWRKVRAYPVFDSNSNPVYAITIGHDYGEEQMDLVQQRHRIETLQNALYEVARSNLEPSKKKVDRPIIDLTKRELQVLRLMAEGLTNPSISGVLSISPHTVKTHVIRIFNKLGVSDRTQAATLATRLNLI